MPALADLRPDFGHREVTRHDIGRLVEIGDRLEQRHDHQVRSARRLAAPPQSGFAREDMDFEQVGQGLCHADDPLADRIAAQPRAHVGGGMDDRQLARGFVAPLVPRRGERAVALQLGGQQRDARFFVQRQIVGAHARHLEQLGEHALVHRAVLPHVKRRKVEPEHLDRADQPPKRTDAAELPLAVRRQPAGDGDQVAAEIGGSRISFTLQRRRPRRRLADNLRIGRAKPRINARQRPAIGLIAAARRAIAARLGQRLDRVGHRGKARRHRQLGAQPMHRVDIVPQHRRGIAPRRHDHRLGGDERIAVAVAADPAADAQEARGALPQLGFPACVKFGYDGQEDVAQIGQRIVDLVGDEQLLHAQRPRLPQQHDLAPDRILDDIALGRFVHPGVAQQHQLGDAILVIEHRLAPHLGRVRGQHRRDE